MTPEKAMARALQLARSGWYTTRPNPRVGCVLVKRHQKIGEGAHRFAGEPHAEVLALQQAGEAAQGAEAFVTLEPCSHFGRTPPCADALIAAGVRKVWMAMLDPNPQVAGQGQARLQAAGISTHVGLMQSEAQALNAGFIQRMLTGRPRLRSKLAMSLDGRTALANGRSQWITGEAARADVQRLRAESGAIITGVDSLLADGARLNVRDPRYTGIKNFPHPCKVIVDGRLRAPLNAPCYTTSGQTVLVCRESAALANPEKLAQLQIQGVEVWIQTGEGVQVDLVDLMQRLGQVGCNDVLLEAGPRLNGAFLQAGLIDQLLIYMAPKLLGDQARGLFALPSLQSLTDAVEYRLEEMRAVGTDWRLTLTPQPSHPL